MPRLSSQVPRSARFGDLTFARSFKPIFFVSTLCLLFATGCRQKQAVVAPPPAKVEIPTIDPELVEALAAVEASHLLFRLGSEAMAEGDPGQAQVFFDRALWELLECQPDHEQARELLYIESGALIDAIVNVEQAATETGLTAGSPSQSALNDLLDDALLEFELSEIEESTPPPNSVDYDMPIVSNRIVESFIQVFSTDKAHIIGAALERSTGYLPMMRRIFKEEGVPLDLCYLPLIESAYKNQARSQASAVGLWQFIASTGRIYSLRINWWLDERMEPEAATRAAARMLRELYGEFDDWYLALCAYNAGPGRVRRAIRRGGTRDFWQLARRRLLPRETIGYVPAFIAGVTIAKNPEKYGYAGIDYQAPRDLTAITVDEGFELKVLAQHLGLDPDILLADNQHMVRGVTPDGTASRLYVPATLAETATTVIKTLPEAERMSWRRYVLKRGDTLGKLAIQFGTSVKALQTLNNINNPRSLRVGQTLMIPKGGRGVYPLLPRNDGSETRLPLQTLTYEVKKGDTLYLISKRFQTTIPSLTEQNKIENPLNLTPGMSLKIQQGDRWERRLRGANRSRGYTNYRIKRGDTLSKIAARFGLSWQRLAAYNGLTQKSVLHVGRRLRIPSKTQNRRSANNADSSVESSQEKVITYRIRKGDTLSQIAKRYKVSVNQLKQWNKLGAGHHIRAGQTLRIHL